MYAKDTGSFQIWDLTPFPPTQQLSPISIVLCQSANFVVVVCTLIPVFKIRNPQPGGCFKLTFEKIEIIDQNGGRF